MKKIVLTTYLLLTLFTWKATAQTAIQAKENAMPLSLQEAVDIALKNNIQVKQSELQIRNAQLTFQQAKNNQLPTVSGSVNESFNFGRSLDPFTNSFASKNINYNSLGVNSNVMIFNGYVLKSTIAQNDLLLKASEFDLQAMKESISLQVVLAYLNILNAEDQLSIAQSQTAITKLQIERTDKLVKAGSLPQSNVFDLKAQLASEETTVINNESTLALAKLSLLQLMNDTTISDVSLTRISVPIPSKESYDVSLNSIFQTAEGSQPLVKASDIRIKSAEKSIDIAKAGFLPTLSGFASWGANQSNAQKKYVIDGTTSTYLGTVNFNGQDYPLNVQQAKAVEAGTVGYFDQLSNSSNYSFGLNASIPIFTRYNNRTRVAQAKVQKLNAEFEAQKTRQTLRQNIETAYTNMNNAAKRYDALTVQVSALEESYRAAESRFNAGAIDYVSYSLQKTNLDKAKANLAQAKYDYVFRTKILDYYQNKPLVF